MISAPPVLERHARVAPLGLRFWDEVTRTTIGDGLIVTAYRATQPDRRFALSLNRTNTFVLHHASGLHDVEFGAGDQAYWDHLPAAQGFIVEVQDTTGRFLPFTLTAAVPTRRFFAWSYGSPADLSGMVPLFSAPARSIPGGFGAIRAELRDNSQFDPRKQDYGPAAWALLEAWYDGKRMGRSLADNQGRVLVLLSYPEPINSPILSPLSPRTALTAQHWPIELRAFYAPLTPVPEIPDLSTALTQSSASLLDTLSPPTPLAEVSVAYGADCIVKTENRSELLISP